jgi:hypothetical protein
MALWLFLDQRSTECPQSGTLSIAPNPTGTSSNVPRKRRNENRGLPARWRLYHGAYYYRVPPGLEAQWGGRKQYRLGSTLGEAASEWAKRMANAERRIVYVRDLLDRYAIEAIPMKAAATQHGDNLALVNLRKVFGEMRLDDLEPRHVYKYVDTRVNKQGQKSPATGVHEIPETKITQRFTEHDLRGKVGSDAESLERARQLLGHADSKITERVYRRKPELIRPLR